MVANGGTSNNITVLLGNGDGTFRASSNYGTGQGPVQVVAGDFNRDGRLDLAVPNFTDNTFSVLLGNGNGTFQAALNYSTGTAPRAVAIGDFNGDGVADLAIANEVDNNLSVFLGSGDGTFQTRVNYAVGPSPASIAVGDFNRDGRIDLAVAGTNSNQPGSTISVLLGNGDGTFQPAINYAAGAGPFMVATGDFNGDGLEDLAVIDYVVPSLSLLQGNGNGTSQPPVNFGLGNLPSFMVVADFNGDGRADFAFADYDNNIVTVILGTAPPRISSSATQLQFSSISGCAAPTAQSLQLTNSGGGTLNWQASSDASWLLVTPSGVAPSLLTISVNTFNLAPGTYRGLITITCAGATNTPQTVSVTLTVAPPPLISISTNQVSFAYTINGTNPPSQSILISNAGGGTLAWSATSSVSWLSVTPSGTAPSNLSISVNPANMTPGPYGASIVVTGNGGTTSQTIAVTLTVSAAASTAVVAAVVNSSSSVPGAVAPGEIVTIFGSGLGPANGVSFSLDPATGMVPTNLSGTQVLFGSHPAPITYASESQINAIVPHEVAGQTSILLQVQYQGATSAGTTLAVSSAAPGIFTWAGTASGQAAAANQDGSFNGDSNPAAKGSYVTSYFTGGGETSPPGVTGSVTSGVIDWLNQPASVTVGGVAATVQFDGAAPLLLDGVGQLNIQLANNTPSGDQIVLLKVGGVSSAATATISIQ